ncbi:MAG: hypothetical protein U0575_03260 [Phycisphaerales bacterium]
MAVLIAMLAALAFGWDPYMQVLRGWAWLFGGESVTRFVVFAVIYPRFTLFSSQVTFITALVATVAMWIQPRPFPWWRMASLWVAAPILAQMCWLLRTSIVRPMIAWADLTGAGLVYNWFADVLVVVASAALLWWALRSILVGIVALVVGALVVCLSVWSIWNMATGWVVPGNLEPGDGWQAALGATMLATAIAQRRRVPQGKGPWCGACGYDLQSIATGRCPECGAEIAVDVSPSPRPPGSTPP